MVIVVVVAKVTVQITEKMIGFFFNSFYLSLSLSLTYVHTQFTSLRKVILVYSRTGVINFIRVTRYHEVILKHNFRHSGLYFAIMVTIVKKVRKNLRNSERVEHDMEFENDVDTFFAHHTVEKQFPHQSTEQALHCAFQYSTFGLSTCYTQKNGRI